MVQRQAWVAEDPLRSIYDKELDLIYPENGIGFEVVSAKGGHSGSVVIPPNDF